MFLISKYRDSNTNPSRKQSNVLFFRLKIACHNAHILKICNRKLFKNALRWYFCQAHFILFVLNQIKFCKSEQMEDNYYNLAIGQSKFSYELTFQFILIKNSGKQKSKNTLRVEINQLCDGKRDTMRNSYVIDKMGGVKLHHPILEK